MSQIYTHVLRERLRGIEEEEFADSWHIVFLRPRSGPLAHSDPILHGPAGPETLLFNAQLLREKEQELDFFVEQLFLFRWRSTSALSMYLEVC